MYLSCVTNQYWILARHISKIVYLFVPWQKFISYLSALVTVINANSLCDAKFSSSFFNKYSFNLYNYNYTIINILFYCYLKHYTRICYRYEMWINHHKIWQKFFYKYSQINTQAQPFRQLRFVCVFRCSRGMRVIDHELLCSVQWYIV